VCTSDPDDLYRLVGSREADVRVVTV